MNFLNYLINPTNFSWKKKKDSVICSCGSQQNYDCYSKGRHGNRNLIPCNHFLKVLITAPGPNTFTSNSLSTCCISLILQFTDLFFFIFKETKMANTLTSVSGDLLCSTKISIQCLGTISCHFNRLVKTLSTRGGVGGISGRK